jgi:trans-aconitate methyltransferase
MRKKGSPGTKNNIIEYYDLLAEDYNSRWVTFVDNQYKVMRPFVDKVYSQFGKGARVADLGCGVGLNSYVLTEMFPHNFDVSCIDVSSEMVKFATKNSPKAKVYQTNFVDWEPENKFHGLVAGSFLNQFDYSMVPYVIEKMSDVMEKDGYALIYSSDTPDYDDNEKIKKAKQNKPYMQMIDRLNMSNLLSQFFKIEDYYKGYGKRGWTIAIVKKE